MGQSVARIGSDRAKMLHVDRASQHFPLLSEHAVDAANSELVAQPRPVAGRVGVALRCVAAHMQLGRIGEGRHALLARPALGLLQQLLAEPTHRSQGQPSDFVAMGQLFQQK